MRSAWPPPHTCPKRPPKTARPVVLHWVGSRRRHHSQAPHETENGTMTRSPRRTFVTAGPRSSTVPMNSWPMTAPVCTSAPPRPWYWCRSEPQTALVVILTTTSVGSTTFGSATSCTRTSPTPWKVIAFMMSSVELELSEVAERDAEARHGRARGGRAEPHHLGLALPAVAAVGQCFVAEARVRHELGDPGWQLA